MIKLFKVIVIEKFNDSLERNGFFLHALRAL